MHGAVQHGWTGETGENGRNTRFPRLDTTGETGEMPIGFPPPASVPPSRIVQVRNETREDQTMKADFKMMQAVGIGETVEAVAVLEDAIKCARQMEAKVAEAKSEQELEIMMEKFARETPLPYLLVGIVGPLRDVNGGLKAVHVAAMMHVAMDVDAFAQRMTWEAMFYGMNTEEIVRKLVDIAQQKKSGLQ